MKKRKILSLLISLCLLISLLPTVALAAYPDSNEAGFKLETDSYTDGVLTVSGHVKLPTAEGISSFNVVLSWDSAVLTLLKRNDANVKYTPTNSKTAYPLSIETFLINGATEEKFGVSEADLYGEAGRAGFKINLYSTGGSIAAQKTTDWVKAFAIKFEVSGKPTDASTVLNSDSLRIADPVKDAGVIKGAFPANNTYTIQVQDAADPAKIYNYGKMAGNSASETEANNFMMAAAGNNTATYPGSTPVTPPTTYTVSFSANGGSGTMAADTGISGSYTLPACTFTAPSDKQFKGWATSASGAVITDTSINVTENTTLYAIWEPIPPTTYTVSFNANGGSGTMAADTGISGSYTLPACTFTAPLGQQFKGWARSASGAVITGTSITVTADTTLYAIWETIPATEYTITFNGNGGTPSAGTMSTAGGKLTSLPTATRSGSYSFDGWYTAASGGTQITTAYVFSANTTVYAHWTYTGGGSGWYYTYFTIKATAGTNGSISPSGWTSVRDGRDQTFTITPDKGYAVAKVLVDGKSVGSVKSYTFKNVTKDHTIEAIFMKSNGNPQTGVFVDVAEGSYYEEAIDWAVEKGITNGVSSNMFAPNDPCTRAQIVTFLWRAAGSPAPKNMSSFTDVPADAFYAKAVAWAVENGITSGTGESKFSPNATCTRAQAVTFLYRASGSPAVSGKAEFSDVSTTAFYADAVTWAAKKGITTGIGGGLFGSDNDCTRGQIVTFLWRAMAE